VLAQAARVGDSCLFTVLLHRPKTGLILFVLLVAIASWFQRSLNPYHYDVIVSIGINIVLAVSLNLLNGYTGQFSLGHAGFMAVGAYFASAVAMGIAFPYLHAPSVETIGGMFGQLAGVLHPLAWAIRAFLWIIAGLFAALQWVHNDVVAVGRLLPAVPRFVLALCYGGAVASVGGFLVGAPSLRLKGDYLAIVTLGFNEIIRVAFQNCQQLGAQTGLNGIPANTNLFWTFLAAGITVYVVTLLVNSTYGRGFLAVRDDEIAAEAMGIDTTKYKVIAFIVGAFFAGIAGGLYAGFKQVIVPEAFSFLRSVDIVVIVILGGMGNTVGVILAAVLLTILPEGLRALAAWELLPVWFRHFAENRMILYSVLLIVLMLARPQGLFAGFSRKRTA